MRFSAATTRRSNCAVARAQGREFRIWRRLSREIRREMVVSMFVVCFRERRKVEREGVWWGVVEGILDLCR